jgi:hypothetical protein
VFLIAVGVLQFLYCVIAGNFVSTSIFYTCGFGFCWEDKRIREMCGWVEGYWVLVMVWNCDLLTRHSLQPFNAFLSGFSATVGQFVLTVSLRMQTNPENKADFESISHERYVIDLSFSDYTHG